jgi:predicted amidohydrolase YtcJ
MTATNDKVFVDGKIFTARNEEEFVSAFKVEGGRISWTGDASEVGSTGAIDLQGKTVSPASSTCTPTPPTWP